MRTSGAEGKEGGLPCQAALSFLLSSLKSYAISQPKDSLSSDNTHLGVVCMRSSYPSLNRILVLFLVK